MQKHDAGGKQCFSCVDNALQGTQSAENGLQSGKQTAPGHTMHVYNLRTSSQARVLR